MSKPKTKNQLKKDLLKKHRKAEKAAYRYFSSCDVGKERDEAWSLYENIRLATARR